MVASPIGVNCEIVRNGENGFLAGTADAWEEVLGRLLGNAGLRQQMGAAGRKRVEDEYCVQRIAPRMAALLQSVGDRK